MGTKQNPAPFDCYTKALPDEPIFTLLGRDDCVYSAVLLWADQRESQIIEGVRPSGDRAIVAEARQWVKDARAWRAANWPARKSEQHPTPSAKDVHIQELLDVVGHQVERRRAAESAMAKMSQALMSAYVALEWFAKANAPDGAGDDFLNDGGYQQAVEIERQLRTQLNRSAAAISEHERPGMWVELRFEDSRGTMHGRMTEETVAGSPFLKLETFWNDQTVLDVAYHKPSEIRVFRIIDEPTVRRHGVHRFKTKAPAEIPSIAQAGEGGEALATTGEGANAIAPTALSAQPGGE